MGEFVSAMQKFYLEKYEDLFYCIIHLGGCLPQAQLCRLLFKNETKNSVSQRLFRDFKKAKLIRVAKMSRGNLIMLAYPTFLHCGLDRTAYYNGKRVKLGSLIMEKHLSRGIYDEPDPASALRKKLESSSYQYYQPAGAPIVRQMDRLIPAFRERGYETHGLAYQRNRANIRAEHFKNELFPGDSLTELSDEIDLFNLSSKGVYLSGVAERVDPFGKKYPVGLVDIYLTAPLDAPLLTKRIVEAKRVVEGILCNDSIADITVYAHFAPDEAYNNHVYNRMSKYTEYALPNTAQEQVHFKFFDTKLSIFFDCDPENIR